MDIKSKRIKGVDSSKVLRAYELMCTARAMSDLYEEKSAITAKYVHATSRGHEAVQLAMGMQLQPQDYLSPYYRDDSILLGMGMKPYELMLQLLAKRDDPFSGGRLIIVTRLCEEMICRRYRIRVRQPVCRQYLQQVLAMGVQYLEKQNISPYKGKDKPVVVCSLGDAAITEGEVSEAFQMAVLKQFPILYFIQDNEWDISAHAKEFRAMDATEYAKGFKGLEVRTIDGTDFFTSWQTIEEVIGMIRKERRPFLIHAKVPLLRSSYFRSTKRMVQARSGRT